MMNDYSPIAQGYNSGGMRNCIPPDESAAIVESVSGKPTIDLAALGKIRLQKQMAPWENLINIHNVNDKVYEVGDDRFTTPSTNLPKEDINDCPAMKNKAMNEAAAQAAAVNNMYTQGYIPNGYMPGYMPTGYGYTYGYAPGYTQPMYTQGYNPYMNYNTAPQPQPQYYQQNYNNQLNYYGNSYNYAYNPYGYTQQSYQEQLKKNQEAYQNQLDIWSMMLVNCHKYFGDDTMTMEQAKEVFAPKQKVAEDYYKDKEEIEVYPTVTIYRGDEIIFSTEKRMKVIQGEEIRMRDMRQTSIQMTNNRLNNGQVGLINITGRAVKYQEEYFKKYPLDMPLDSFFGLTGSYMYIDYINDIIKEQQQHVNLLYDNSLYGQLIKQHTKNTNPYAYNSFLQSIANNGRIDQPKFNLGDMEIDLPASMQTEAARRRHEFMEKIFSRDKRLVNSYGSS